MIVRMLAACAAAFYALLPLAATAQASAWPPKPVRFVLPFPPGGTVDLLARLLSSRLTPALAALHRG